MSFHHLNQSINQSITHARTHARTHTHTHTNKQSRPTYQTFQRLFCPSQHAITIIPTQHISIYSCSWGPNDDGARLEGPKTLTRTAIENGFKNGRNGKGSIYVWASGNGKSYGDSCSYDGYTSMRQTITVTSIDESGRSVFHYS